jgi:peptidyl-dipeptidase Dcp
VQEGVFAAAELVYGLSFRRRDDLIGYHPDVVVHEVFDADGQPIGLFLGDYYTRPGKQGGAWMESLVAQNRLLDQRPVVVNNLNLAKPPAGQPTLLSADEIRTLFHEFGHALHGLLSSVTYPRLAGTAVSKDFVEYPSQVNEMWATDAEVASRYARHIDTGQSLPEELAAALSAEGGPDQARETVSFLAATWLDLAWHRLDEGEVDEAASDIDAFESRALGEVGLDVAAIPPRYRSRYFNHIFSSGYAAGYYSYIWSEILDADTVEWFTEHRDELRTAGDEFRAALLSRGGSGDEMGYFEAFRGRPPQIEPLLRRRGLLVE